MQKWSPEPFVAEFATAAPGAQPEGEEFAAVETPGDNAGVFRRDFMTASQENWLALMNKEERAQVYQLVENDVRKKYEQKLAAAEASWRGELQEWRDSFAAAFAEEVGGKLRLLARQTGALAVALAERIVRRCVEVDQEVLVRALEVVLNKLEAGSTLTVKVNAADAEYLANNPELLAKLRISQVVTDRRVERGGCLAVTSLEEWDATVAGQMECLAEIVQEALSGDFPLSEATEENAGDDPAVE